MPRKREAPPRMSVGDADNNTRARLAKLFHQLPGLKEVPPAERDALADSLAEATQYAAAGVPRMAARVQKPTSTGKRRPGGGRPPDQTREVLASNVAEALLAQGLPAKRWQDGADGGLLPEVCAACWQVATGEKMRDGDGCLEDWRRITHPKRRWRRPVEAWSPCPKTGLWLPTP